MEVKKKIIIEIEGKDHDNLKSGLQKITDKIREVGFKRDNLTNEETEAIQELTDKLK